MYSLVNDLLMYPFRSLEGFIVFYFIMINLFYLVLLVSSCRQYYKKKTHIDAQQSDILLRSEELPSITLIIPAYNEELLILDTLKNILNVPYRNKKVIVVNDGSTDRTMHLLKSAYKLSYFHGCYENEIPTTNIKNYFQSLVHPDLMVIDKENGGIGDALNAGVNACNTDYYIVIDADTIIDHVYFNVLLHHYFATGHVKAGEMALGIINSCTVGHDGITKSSLPTEYLLAVQVVEYFRAFAVGRGGWACFGGPALISGSCSFYDTKTVKELGGYDPNNLGQDFELSFRFKKEMIKQGRSYQSEFFEEPVGWTQVPFTLQSLTRQRIRWQTGLIQTLWKHKDVLFNPRYHVLGYVIYPYYLFTEVLTPIIELLGYFMIFASIVWGIGNSHLIAFFILLSWAFSSFLTLMSISLDMTRVNRYTDVKDSWKMILYSFLENVGFRQLTFWWRLKVLARCLAGNYTTESMERTPIR